MTSLNRSRSRTPRKEYLIHRLGHMAVTWNPTPNVESDPMSVLCIPDAKRNDYFRRQGISAARADSIDWFDTAFSSFEAIAIRPTVLRPDPDDIRASPRPAANSPDPRRIREWTGRAIAL